MNKNYYEILEVDKNASFEVIEKAYKTLAKKYHPDLQDEASKKEAEEKLKSINEAYEVLSNPDMRSNYDSTLKSSTITEDDFKKIQQENQHLQQELNEIRYNTNSPPFSSNSSSKQKQNNTEKIYNQQNYNRKIQEAKEQAYHDAYIQDLKNRGYRIRYRKTPKDYLKSFLSILITIAILFLLWQIPFVKNFFVRMYEENPVIKMVVDLFLGIFQ